MFVWGRKEKKKKKKKDRQQCLVVNPSKSRALRPLSRARKREIKYGEQQLAVKSTGAIRKALKDQVAAAEAPPPQWPLRARPLAAERRQLGGNFDPAGRSTDS